MILSIKVIWLKNQEKPGNKIWFLVYNNLMVNYELLDISLNYIPAGKRTPFVFVIRN
jgi:hypothetical protein